MRDGGETFVAIGDNAQVLDGRFQRENGRLTGVVRAPIGALQDVDGVAFFRKPQNTLGDSEGLALIDGGYAISFERDHRVMIYRDGAVPKRVELPRDIQSAGENGGVEALAVDAMGRLIAIPDTRTGRANGFPVWRQTTTGWEVLGEIARTQGFAPVGADIGPRGRLFVLERAFRGIGFQSRIRVFAPDALTPEGQLLWATPVRAYDNLEGISVWQDPEGLRVTMISDDNYNWFQRTEIVEFRLTE